MFPQLRSTSLDCECVLFLLSVEDLAREIPPVLFHSLRQAFPCYIVYSIVGQHVHLLHFTSASCHGRQLHRWIIAILLLTTLPLAPALMLTIIIRHLRYDLPSLLDIALIVGFTAVHMYGIGPSSV
jgi:hypothetical protein